MALTFSDYVLISDAYDETLDEGALWDRIKSSITGADPEARLAKLQKDAGADLAKIGAAKKAKKASAGDIAADRIAKSRSKDFYARRAETAAAGEIKAAALKAADARMSQRAAMATASKQAFAAKPISAHGAAGRRALDRSPFSEAIKIVEAQNFTVTYELRGSDRLLKTEISGMNVTRVKRKFEDTHHGAKIITIVPAKIQPEKSCTSKN